jgi:pyridoxal phosphate enzyme (YggS family)
LAELIRGIRPEVVQGNLERIRQEIDQTGRDPASVQILAAVKYVAYEELEVLAQAGVSLLGENRAQDLVAKAEAYPGRFTWDFIGHLQSRKVRSLLPYVRYLQTVASDSALAQLARHAEPDTEVLVEVNVAAEAGKSGIAPSELPGLIARSPVRIVGLMTMPPLAARAEDSRPYFAALRALAARNGLRELSMGTSQDYQVAVEEGATIVRLGTKLFSAS